MNINIEMLKNDIIEVNIICINYHNYRYSVDEEIDKIEDFEKILRILFKDGSIIDFTKKNI